MKLCARQAVSIVSNISIITVPFGHVKIKYRLLERHVVILLVSCDIPVVYELRSRNKSELQS